jgi:hypothetical protein
LQVNEFIETFSNRLQWTCESQPDYIDETTTHLIANDSGLCTTVMTKQVIQACLRHIFIGSIDWVVSCLIRMSLLDYFPYEILRDRKSSKDSRGIKQCRFDQLPVFPSSYVFAVECQQGLQDWGVERDELLHMIELSGATLYDEHLSSPMNLIVLCKSKDEMQRQCIENRYALSGTIVFCQPEFFFNSIVRHQVQPIEQYRW